MDKEIMEYVNSCRVKNNRYNTIKSTLIASFYRMSTYEKTGDIYFNGKRIISFTEATEIREEFNKNY